MGRGNKRKKKKNKHNYNNYQKRRLSTIEDINHIAESIFGGRYYCVGEHKERIRKKNGLV